MCGSLFIWIPVLLVAVWAAHWGAEHLSDPLKKLRRQMGFSVAAGGAFVGLTAASPEIGINATSALRGVGDIGLGALLGSNVLAIPMMVVTAYFATRKRGIGEKGGHENHEAHRREHLLQVGPQAVTVQALPYLGIIALFAFLTLPAPWRGLQPIDGWILLLGYLVQALLRGRKEGEEVGSRHRLPAPQPQAFSRDLRQGGGAASPIGSGTGGGGLARLVRSDDRRKKKEEPMLWFWLMILLLALFILLLPPWPYMRERDTGYGPSGVALGILILLLLLWWFGQIAVW